MRRLRASAGENVAALAQSASVVSEAEGCARASLVANVEAAGERGIEDFLPAEPWKRYMRAVVPSDAEKVPTERKTGVKRAEVVTVQLVQDKHGWLRLAS